MASRIRAPLFLLAMPLLALAACGGDDSSPEAAGTLPPATSTSPTAVPVTTGRPSYDLATGADDVVISVRYDGGFAPVGAIFARTPVALITGDGRALTTGPVPAIYPGPLLPNVLERSITPDAIQQLVAMADRLGLLADVTYPPNDRVADAANTIVDVTVGGRTFQHDAYALGIDETEVDAARKRLLDFVNALSDLEGTVGSDALGPEQPLRPDRYLIQAVVTDLATSGTDVAPTVVPWPADAPVRLADATTCAALPTAVAAPLFDDANARTYFTDAGVTYYVAAVQQVPGRAC
jgi:hypothetical protein